MSAPVARYVSSAERSAAYVTVMPATPRKGWLVASRHGGVIKHTRLDVTIHNREGARAAAAELFPGVHVYVQGDEYKPWVTS